MVFQAAKKTTSTTGSNSDFQDLEMVKAAEVKSIHAIENAVKNAEKIVAQAKADLIRYKEKAAADLTKKLEQDFKIKEELAKKEAIKIKAKGGEEANRLKQEVMNRVPSAANYVVKVIIGD
ncbi:hypothetical protein [[Eubacterium] cellulosolvens]